MCHSIWPESLLTRCPPTSADSYQYEGEAPLTPSVPRMSEPLALVSPSGFAQLLQKKYISAYSSQKLFINSENLDCSKMSLHNNLMGVWVVANAIFNPFLCLLYIYVLVLEIGETSDTGGEMGNWSHTASGILWHLNSISNFNHRSTLSFSNSSAFDASGGEL